MVLEYTQRLQNRSRIRSEFLPNCATRSPVLSPVKVLCVLHPQPPKQSDAVGIVWREVTLTYPLFYIYCCSSYRRDYDKAGGSILGYPPEVLEVMQNSLNP